MDTLILGLTGLVGYWKFDETSGSTADNIAPATAEDSNYDGTIVGGVALGESTDYGDAFDYDGTTGQVVIQRELSARGQSLISIGAIIEVKNVGVARAIWYESLNNSAGFRVLVILEGDERINVFVKADDSASTSQVWTSAALSVGIHFVKVTIDVTTGDVIVYVDGASVAMSGTLANLNDTAIQDADPQQTMRIGSRLGGSAFFDGTMNQVFVCYGHLLTAAEAAELAEAAGF